VISEAELLILQARMADIAREDGGNPVPAQPAPEPKRQKFGSRWCEVDGHKFQSQKEAEAYVKLKALADKGVITQLRMQVPFVLQEEFGYGGKTYQAIRYFADFSWMEDGRQHVVDVKSKGTKTPLFICKWKLVLKRYPELVWEVWE
jgi:hypothetical protein